MNQTKKGIAGAAACATAPALLVGVDPASAAAAAVVVATAVVVAAAIVVAATVVAETVIGQDKDQDDEQDPVVIVAKAHGVNLLSHLSLPYYAEREKG